MVLSLSDAFKSKAFNQFTIITSSSRASRSFNTSSVSITHILKSGNYDKPNKNPLRLQLGTQLGPSLKPGGIAGAH